MARVDTIGRLKNVIVTIPVLHVNPQAFDRVIHVATNNGSILIKVKV